jgi:hypothetical protein
MIVRELLDVIFNETVDIPLEHWAGNVESELLRDVLVNPLGIRRATHSFDPKQFKVALVEVMETMTGEHVVNSDD